MIGYLFGSTLRELARPKRIIVWFSVLLLLALMMFAWITIGKSGTDIQTFVRLTETVVFRFQAFAAAILCTAIISGEVEQRTIVYLLTRPIPRWQLLVGRFLATGTFVALLMVVMVALTALISGQSIFQKEVLQCYAAVTLGSFAYGGIYVLISLLANRALQLGLLYAFGWETMVTSMPGDAYYLSIGNHVKGLANLPSMEAPASRLAGMLGQGGLAPKGIEPPVAILSLIGTSVVLMLISCWWFQRNEYVAREDAE